MVADRFRTARLRAAAVAVLALGASLLASSSAQAAPRDFFGVMPQAPLEDADYQRMGQAKVGTLRFEIPWAAVDPTATPGDTDFSSIDATMTRLAQEGIEPLPFLFGTPVWAAQLDGQNCADVSSCIIHAPRSSTGRALWRTFVTEVVDRYGRNGDFWAENPGVPFNPIRVIQIWNEQNSDSFYAPKPNVKRYAKLLDASDDGVAAARTNVDILLGGMFGTPQHGRKPSIAAWNFLEKLYDVRGAKRDFDGVAPHPYASSMKKVRAQVELLRDEIRRARDRKVELWITELGWGSSGPRNPLVKGKQGQANRLRQAFKYFLRKRRSYNIETVIWYSWRDNPATDVGLCEWCPGSGLVTKNLKAKPALRQFTKFTRGS